MSLDNHVTDRGLAQRFLRGLLCEAEGDHEAAIAACGHEVVDVYTCPHAGGKWTVWHQPEGEMPRGLAVSRVEQVDYDVLGPRS